MRLFLASASPRRAQLLQQIGVPFSRLGSPQVDETPLPGEAALDYVRRLAQDKACALALPAADGLILGADTAVVVDDEILGKPTDDAAALAMLRRLNNRSHQVMSAICLRSNNALQVRESVTRVRFRQLSEAQLQAYLATGEGRDKAGSYGIQGLGAALVESIEGSYSGVVGLPLEQLAELLDAVGARYWQAPS